MMPNRLLKEGICTSDSINALSPEEEILFYRLLVVCDDYGHADARPAIIKAQCFPLKDNATPAKAAIWIKGLAEKGMIRRYEAAGKPYLAMCKWENRVRTHPKHPQPEAPGSRWIDETEQPENGFPQSAADREQDSATCGLGLGLGQGKDKGEGELKHTDLNTPVTDYESKNGVCVTSNLPPSQAGLCCKAIKNQGIPQVNPSNPTLLALIAAGATEDEFANAAKDAVLKGNTTFPYVLGIVKRQREQAAKLVLHQGRMPTKQEAIEERNRAVAAQWMPPELREKNHAT